MTVSRSKLFALGIIGLLLALMIYGFAWYIILSMSILLFGVWSIYVFIYFTSLLSMLGETVYVEPKNCNFDHHPIVSILLPLYREKRESIEKTVNSILSQEYPHDKIEVIFIVEPDDLKTSRIVDDFIPLLKSEGFNVKKVVSDGKLKIKAHALNVGFMHSSGDIIGVYDADDEFPSDQIRKIVKMFIDDGYGAIGTKVYRYRNSKIGKLLNLEMYIWYNMYLPVIYKISKAPPLSGEGLFVKREALEAIGGFPEKLTEDAYITIKMKEAGYKIGLLKSEVVELAPKSLKGLFKQRLRWYRGYIECVGGIINAELPKITKIVLLLAFGVPAILSLGFIQLSIAMGYTFLSIFIDGFKIITLETILSNLFLFTWSLLITVATSVFYALLYSKMSKDDRWKPFAKFLLIMPIYWIMLAAITFYLPFVDPKIWYKTERR